MSTILRGGKNAFRNAIRAVSVALIVGLSIGLALVMVLSVEAVQLRIDAVSAAIGSRITISPAGSVMGVGGVPLSSGELGDLKAIPHVTSVVERLSAQLAPGTDTSLRSSIENFSQPGSTMGPVTMPVFGTGTSDLSHEKDISGHVLKLTAGSLIDAAGDSDTVLVGKGIADKNSLKVGSTFQVYKTTVTVAGIFTTGNMWADNIVYFPLATLQRIAQQPGAISLVYANVDTVDNIASVQGVVAGRVGQAADITTTQQIFDQAVGPLLDVKRIATQDLIGCLVAGAVIIFLTMLMIVRERRREIGVLKAIGASDATVVVQFVAEALVLALIGAAVGGIIGAFATTPVFNQLVLTGKANAGTSATGSLDLGFKAGWAAFTIVRGATNNLHADVGFGMIGWGFLVALLVAVLGSAAPAWLIARIRPAEVMRNE
jgi:putative ABC transport system permease protein